MINTKIISATLMALLFCASASAADKKAEAAATVNANKVDMMKIDTAQSTVKWKGMKKIGSFHEGGIKIKSGQVMMTNGQITGGQVVVDMKTITNTDLTDKTYNDKLVGHLSNEDFFNVKKYPTSTFKFISSAPGKTAGEMMIKGELTMIGQTGPIEFPATVKMDQGMATGTATIKIDRTKWGLKYGSGNFFKELAGDKIINDEFEITLNLVAKK